MSLDVRPNDPANDLRDGTLSHADLLGDDYLGGTRGMPRPNFSNECCGQLGADVLLASGASGTPLHLLDVSAPEFGRAENFGWRAAAPVPRACGGILDAQPFGPLGKAARDTVVRDEDVVTLIPRLHRDCGQTTVTGFVVSIDVDTVNGQAIRDWSDVHEEGFKGRSPLRAHFDATSPVIRISAILRVATPSNHRAPCCVFTGSTHPVRSVPSGDLSASIIGRHQVSPSPGARPLRCLTTVGASSRQLYQFTSSQEVA